MRSKNTSYGWRSGEPFIWLTSVGLTGGLLMVIGLLGVIVYNGVTVFWPSPVRMLTLREGSSDSMGPIDMLAGEYVRKQQRRDALGVVGESGEEWQFFVGNRDRYRVSYKWVDTGDIIATNYPQELMVVERLEYGDAICIPIALELPDAETIPADVPEFETTLKSQITEVWNRWDRIKHIEKKEIGDINRQLNRLRLQKRGFNDHEQLTGIKKQALEHIDQQIDALQKQFVELADQAKQLRDQQNEARFIYQIPSGQDGSMVLGNIVHYYYPNRLSWWGRVLLFLRNLWVFVSADPREANTEGGIFPAIFGTFVMTLLMSLTVMPFGVLAAIYLREYAHQGFFVRIVRIAVNNLAGVPSIVFGVFGLGFFVYMAGGTIDSLFYSAQLPTPTFGTGGIFWASLTLALMTVPVVIVSTEEGLAAVPRGMREASLALGASKWQTVARVVLPASSPGMLTGLILAMARGAGEVAPLMLVGVVKMAPSLPLDGTFPYVHLERKFMHLGFHIFDLGFQSPDSEAAQPMVFATTLLLIGLVVVLNLSAIFIRERLKRKLTRSGF